MRSLRNCLNLSNSSSCAGTFAFLLKNPCLFFFGKWVKVTVHFRCWEDSEEMVGWVWGS
jgi:hypothetical protein